MKNKLIVVVLMAISVLSLSACFKEEEKKAEKPIEDAGELMADILGETEETTEEKETGETESIDYDKLDEQLMQEMIAGGAATDVVYAGSNGTSTDGPGTSSDPEEISLGSVYYKATGWNLFQNNQGMRIYNKNYSQQSIGIYAVYVQLDSSMKNFIISAYEEKMNNVYGDYDSKTQYTNANGLTFNRYKYNTNKLSNNIIVEVFLYTNGNAVVYVESAVIKDLGAITQDIYDFVDTIRMK